jgi:hypothetical protein
MEQAENGVTGMEDKVKELDQSKKDQKTKKIQTEYERPLGHHQKPKPTNYGYRRRKEDTN